MASEEEVPARTSHIDALRELRESLERFRTICEHAPVMIDSFDERGHCLLWNRECERRLGYTQQEIADAEDPLALCYPDPKMRERVLASITRADGQFREYRVRAKDSSQRVQRWADFRLPTGATISVGYDVTEQRAIEAQLRQSQKMEAVGQLTGGIAHDFNNLLTVVLTCAEMLRRNELYSSKAHMLVDQITEAARDGAELVRKLLAFSRQEMLSFGAVDLGELVRDLAPTLRRLLPETITVDLRIQTTPRIHADVGAVRQIIINLCTNARDAMPDGGIIAIEVVPRATSDGERVALSVRDDGHGMSDEVLRRSLEPFFTTKPRGSGTGLGLATVYGLMTQHGGSVEIRSERDVGTTVTATFVRASPAPIVERSRESEPVASAGAETILLVEDQPEILDTARRVLVEQGYRVLTATDGSAALEVFDRRAESIDLVLSDAVMPNVGGRELYRELRRRGYTGRFLLTSGYAGGAVGEANEEADEGELRVFYKPWSASELLAEIRRSLDEP